MQDVYTIKEVAELLKCSQGSVYKLIRNKEIKAKKIGHLKILKNDLDFFLNN